MNKTTQEINEYWKERKHQYLNYGEDKETAEKLATSDLKEWLEWVND